MTDTKSDIATHIATLVTLKERTPVYMGDGPKPEHYQAIHAAYEAALAALNQSADDTTRIEALEASLAEAREAGREEAAKEAENFQHPIESRQRRGDNGKFRKSDKMQLVPSGADIAKAIRALKGTTDELLPKPTGAELLAQGWQHVAYYEEGRFHWVSGIAPRACELYQLKGR